MNSPRRFSFLMGGRGRPGTLRMSRRLWRNPQRRRRTIRRPLAARRVNVGGGHRGVLPSTDCSNSPTIRGPRWPSSSPRRRQRDSYTTSTDSTSRYRFGGRSRRVGRQPATRALDDLHERRRPARTRLLPPGESGRPHVRAGCSRGSSVAGASWKYCQTLALLRGRVSLRDSSSSRMKARASSPRPDLAAMTKQICCRASSLDGQ